MKEPSDQKGYEKVEYNSGYEKQQRKRKDMICGYGESPFGYEHESETEFVERNNVRDRI